MARKKRRKPRKKWGKIGSPKSPKRRRWLRKIAKKPRRMSWKKRGYKSKRAYLLDRARKAKYRPAKKYKKGRGNQGDWARKRYRKSKKRR